MKRPRLAAVVGALGAALAAGCAPDLPEPLPRLVAWTPQGSGVAVDAEVRLEFSGPMAPLGLVDGRRVALTRATDARAVATAIDSTDGPGATTPSLPCRIELDPDGRRARLLPDSPLSPGTSYALVVGTGLQGADGRPALDPEGRRRTFIATFETVPGPPPRPVVTEVRAHAASPEAGGEYVEVLNLGEGPLDLTGWRLEKRTAAGALAGCLLGGAEGGAVAPGRYGLVTGSAWDSRYATPAGLSRFACAGSTLAGGLANDRPPEVRLVDPGGAVRATFGAGGVAPICPAAVERIDPEAPDQADNLACADGEGSPGACNTVSAWCR